MDPHRGQRYLAGPPQYQDTPPAYREPAYSQSHIQSFDGSPSMPGAFPPYRPALPAPGGSSQPRSDLSAGNNAFKDYQDQTGASVRRSYAPPREMVNAATHIGSSDGLQDIYIAIMGVTGAGKSEFIKHCSESQKIKVGHGLRSCTQDVGEHTFVLGDKLVHLIDTPGFDDTTRTDREVLDEIATWFGVAYKANIELTGIVYIHRITETRMAGTAFTNLRMFKKLCGENFYPRVSLTTTFWDTVSRKDGEFREKELISTDEFWGQMFEQGSKVYRHYGNRESAMKILTSIMDHRKDKKERMAPSYVRVQREMAEENKSLDETSAGQEVNAKILEERKKFERQLKEAKEDMQTAMRENDRRAADSIRKHKEAIEKKLLKGHEEQMKMNVRLEDMQIKHMEELEKLQNALEEQKSLMETLKAENREKDERLGMINSRSSQAVGLRREIQENNDNIARAEEEVEQQTQVINEKKNMIRQAAEWIKKHPNLVSKAGMLGVQVVQHVLNARHIRHVERYRSLHEPNDVEYYEIVELDDEHGPSSSQHPASGSLS